MALASCHASLGECESDNIAPNGRKRADLFKAVSLGHGR